MVTDKDLTIFTFRLGNPCENSIIYNLCEQSWKTHLPNATIVKIDFNQAMSKYQDKKWIQWLKYNRYGYFGKYLDAFKIFYAQKYERSIYLDSDMYLYSSPLESINANDKSAVYTYNNFYIKRGDSTSNIIYNFYNENFFKHKKIKKIGNGNFRLLPTDYDIIVDIVPDRYQILDVDHCDFKTNITYIFLSTDDSKKNILYNYILKREPLFTTESVRLVIEDTSTSRYFDRKYPDTYITFDFRKLKRLMIDYMGRSKSIFKCLNYNLQELSKFKLLDPNFKLFIQNMLE